MADYQGKKVVIIGLGLTGLSCVDFFLAWRDAARDGYACLSAGSGQTAGTG
jgi:NADPH-dependent glutamate synthase beta subunit-like oxidoreductase